MLALTPAADEMTLVLANPLPTPTRVTAPRTEAVNQLTNVRFVVMGSLYRTDARYGKISGPVVPDVRNALFVREPVGLFDRPKSVKFIK